MSYDKDKLPELAYQWFDNFNSGYLVLDPNKNILFCNRYLSELIQLPVSDIIDTPISQYLTKASSIFIETYIYPLLLAEQALEESQMSWVIANGDVIPVVANIRLTEDGTSFWSLYVCTNRDKLHAELIKTRDQLVEQTKNLYSLATTDPLTGLLNRRELLTQANIISHQANRNQSSYAVLAVDVDFFKKVNDTYGHQAGDDVLVALAQSLTMNVRQNDLVARVGGEEFLILLSDIQPNDVFSIAEKIRLNVAAVVVHNIPITVSIGAALFVADTNYAFSQIWTLADKALYQSKHNGRNQTTIVNH